MNNFQNRGGPPPRKATGGTLAALTQIVDAKKKQAPRGKAYGYHRKRQTPGADLGPLAGRPLPKGKLLSDASRQDNFQRELGMNRRPLSAPRRSAPKPIY